MTEVTKSAIVSFGAFTVDAGAGELRKHGVRVKLAGQPFQILHMLLTRAGGVVTREELRAALWQGDTFVDFDHSLSAAVNKLRDALNDSAENPRYIETLPRRGYRFIGQINGHAPAAAVEPGASAAVQPAPAQAVASPAHAKLWFAAATLLALLAIAGALAFNLGGLRARLFGPPTAPGPALRSLAVLPFTNLSNDPEQEYFADGMTEELITQLAQVRALRVISRTSVMRYKQSQKPLPEIGRELGVEAVVEGAVMRVGGRVRISAQLLNAATDQHLWAQTYERDLADVIVLQREVARAIAEQVRVQITPQERAQLTAFAPVKPEAYQEYLLGRFYQHKAIGWATVKAIEHYRQALALDPDYVPAYTGLAHSLVFAQSPRVSMPKAKAAAEKALQLAPSDPEAHVALGVVRGVWEWDWAGSEQSYKRALELDPNSAYAHHGYSVLLASLGRFEQAIAEGKRAMELDPLAANLGHTLGRIYYFARRYDDALRQYKATLEKDPTDYWSWFFLAILYDQLGDGAKAASCRFRAGSLTAGISPQLLEALREIYDAEGYPGLLRATVRVETQLPAKNDLISATVALTYCRLGEKEKALEWLEYAFASHTRDLVYLNVEPQYDLIRNEPRFQALLLRMKFPARL